jgi:2-succinyl-5-enolpyruvyl-6-hydroxy-3-cyclohexene-1-carboxylate synthase
VGRRLGEVGVDDYDLGQDRRVNPSTAQARVIIDELIRCGVTDIVLAPGSRSAPLALAAADAEQVAAVQLHVRIDERSAGYLAVGLAHVTGVPAAVITTSGTAAVNVHPAVVEAAHSGTPLLVLTADRPAALHGVGANQTIHQRDLYSSARPTIDMPPAIERTGQVAIWRSIIARAVAQSTDVLNPGPVHINIPLTEPLVPDGDEEWCEPLAGRADERPWHADARMVGGMSSPLDEVLNSMFDDHEVPARGLILVGHHRDPDAADLAEELGSALGWPIIAEPSGNVGDAETALAHGALVAADRSFIDSHIPDIVITVGNIGLHRSVQELIRRAPLHIVVDSRPDYSDPTRTADLVLTAVPLAPGDANVDESWLADWQRADVLASAASETALASEGDPFTGMHVARIVTAAVPQDGLLFLGPSWPVRHVSAFAGNTDALVLGNRGTSGIDGCVSSAWGAAAAWQRQGMAPTVALIGDLAFWYDSNGLLVPDAEERPNLVYVISDNDGGGIFSALEQGDARFADTFERVFGTPLGRDIAAVVEALGYRATTVAQPDELDLALKKALASTGVHFIIARTCDRQYEAKILRTVDQAIHSALDSA